LAVPEAAADADALDADALDTEAEVAWLADSTDADDAVDMVATEADEAMLGEAAAALVTVATAIEVPADPPAVVDTAPLMDWPTQLESVPVWIVMGDEYWMLPSVSRTWMVIEVPAKMLTVHT